MITNPQPHSSEASFKGLLYRPLVMVIEDDKSYRKLWHKIIVERVGARCIEAENPVDAFKTFIDTLPDLIIIDLLTPKMNGYTAVHRLRQTPQTKDIPIVVCTGSTQKEEIRRLMQLGISEYIVKPLNGSVVVDRIQSILADIRSGNLKKNEN